MKKKTLADMWNVCPLCGEHITNMESANREHLIPLCRKYNLKGHTINFSEFVSLSHSICNSHKGSKSLISTMKELDEIKQFMGKKVFRAWVNQTPCRSKRITIFLYVGHSTKQKNIKGMSDGSV